MSRNRVLQLREGDPTLTHTNNYQDRIRAIEKCAQVAHNHGDEVFAVQVRFRTDFSVISFYLRVTLTI